MSKSKPPTKKNYALRRKEIFYSTIHLLWDFNVNKIHFMKNPSVIEENQKYCQK